MSRKYFAAAAVLAVVASVWGAPVAAAAPIPEFNPLTTNVPYLAWRGEQLRLVKCLSPHVDGESAVALFKDDGDGSRRWEVDWLVEDWSGYPFQPPQLEKSTVAFFRGNNEYWGAPCVKASFASLKAGLAQIKLVISDARTGNPVVKHQFLAGWLSINTPTLREVSAAIGPTDPPGGGGVLGDPAGDGIFIAGSAPGRVQVHVTGNLPLGNNFTELGLPASINLPTEANGDTFWDDLAQRMATTSDFRPFYRDAPWRMWDIHDDRARTEGHVSLGLCPPGPLTVARRGRLVSGSRGVLRRRRVLAGVQRHQQVPDVRPVRSAAAGRDAASRREARRRGRADAVSADRGRHHAEHRRGDRHQRRRLAGDRRPGESQ